MQLEGSYADRRGTLRGRGRPRRAAPRASGGPPHSRRWRRPGLARHPRAQLLPEDRWSLAHPVAVTYEGSSRLHVNDFVFASEKSRITANGTVDRGGEQRMRVALDTVPLGWVTELLGLPELDGRSDRRVELTGPAAAPRLAGRSGSTFRLGESRWPEPPSCVDWRPADGLGVELAIHQPRGDSLRIVARAPLLLSLAAGDSATGLVRRSPERGGDARRHRDDFHLDPFERLIDPAHARQAARPAPARRSRAREPVGAQPERHHRPLGSAPRR